MKRSWILFSTILACLLVFGLLSAGPLTDQAQAKKYKIWVGGKQVTSKNAKHVLGNSKVKYNAKTRTLTLKNATIKGVRKFKQQGKNYYVAIANTSSKSLKIKLVGKNKVCAKRKSNAAYSAGIATLTTTKTTTIYGSGSLTVKGNKASRYSYGIATDKLKIKGKVKIKAYGSDTPGVSRGILTNKTTISGSAKVTASGFTGAFATAPTFASGYTPKVKAGYSASNIVVSKTSPASSTYTTRPYVAISKAKSKKPGKVTISSITPMASGLGVKWNVLKSNCTGYQYQLSTNSSFSSDSAWSYTSPYKMNGGYINGASATNLSGGTKYFVRVRGVNKVGSKTYYGPWSPVKSATTYEGEAAG